MSNQSETLAEILTQRVAAEAKALSAEGVGYPTPPADLGEAGREIWAAFGIVLNWRNLWDIPAERGLTFIARSSDLVAEGKEIPKLLPVEVEWFYYRLAVEIFRPDVKKALRFPE